jgi:archaetidylinositol phosphate synthase
VVFILDQLALGFHRLGLTPNSSTVLGLVFAVAAGFLLYSRVSDLLTFWVAPLLVLISGFFDMIDGSLARMSQRATKYGGVLDSTLDRLGEIFILSGIILGGLSSLSWGLVAISASLMVSYVRARSEVEGVRMSGVGIAERPERMLVLVAALLLRSIEYGIILIGVLSCVSVVQRLFHAYRSLH